MCGIIGFNEPGRCPREVFSRMVDCMAARGPDARGEWHGENVSLGHRRLSVLDLSANAAQPMCSEDGMITVVHNGEIYNHPTLRERMGDVAWRSHSDTETILRLYEKDGSGFVRHLDGMFALAIHDRCRNRLFLYRDRMGEKPLYYWFRSGLFMFASQLRPFTMHPDFSREIDPEALRLFFLYNYIPAPHSIYRDVRKLKPGRMLEFDLEKKSLEIRRYWSLPEPGEESGERKEEEWLDEFGKLFEASVARRLLSDVPLGCFLSGGVDSSAVVAAARRAADRPISTFTIGFREGEYDESRKAREVARILGSDHHEEIIGPGDMRELVDRIPDIYDEPFADASCIPTVILSRWTRRHVTVALSGDGGDELFCGYDRYRWADRVYTTLGRTPPGIRVPIARSLSMLPAYRSRMVARGMQFHSPREIYPYVFIGWNHDFASRILLPSFADKCRFPDRSMRLATSGFRRDRFVESAARTDLRHYLPDDLLVKLDRATMSCSLESRTPFLDHRLVEFAQRVPGGLKMNGRNQKIIVKNYLRRFFPQSIIGQRKMGFAVPLKHWFRGELKPLLCEALEPSELRRQGLLDEVFVGELMKQHFSGRYNHERQLWAIYTFQLWHRRMMQ